MNTTTIIAHEISEDLMKLAGYQVCEDSDQQGYFTWVRAGNGAVKEGCDASFESLEEAWDEVRFIIAERLEDEGLDAEEWNALTAEQRHMAICEHFG